VVTAKSFKCSPQPLAIGACGECPLRMTLKITVLDVGPSRFNEVEIEMQIRIAYLIVAEKTLNSFIYRNDPFDKAAFF
jgi:hypothetical protein